MPVDTINYDPALEEMLRHPIQHLYKVTAHPQGGAAFELAVTDELEVGFSLGWSPYAEASLTIKTPTDPAQAAALDGRLRTLLSVELGYNLGGGATSMNEAVKLRLRDTAEDVLTGTTRITLHGAELDAQDAAWKTDWNGAIPRTGIREAIEYVLAQSLNGAVTLTGTGTGIRADLVANVNPAHGENLWSIAEGIAASAGLKLWHDGAYTWKLLPRYTTTAGTYATMLRTGKTGTITSITRNRSRDVWFNEVDLEYPDTDQGNGTPIRGRAYVYDGPTGFSNVGYKTYSKSIKGWINKPAADAAAWEILKTLHARGDTYTIQAVAAYWLRPGMILPLKTGRGPYETHLVESVKFQPLNGLMTVETIKNEDTVIPA